MVYYSTGLREIAVVFGERGGGGRGGGGIALSSSADALYVVFLVCLCVLFCVFFGVFL